MIRLIRYNNPYNLSEITQILISHLLQQISFQPNPIYSVYNLIKFAMNCKLYCLAICAFSVFFLLYLFFLVVTESESLYIEVHNHATSAVALFISALVYAGIFGYLYYSLFMNVSRKDQLKRWVQERKELSKMRQLERRERDKPSSRAEFA